MTVEQKVALITGITGQDGSFVFIRLYFTSRYLAEFLLEKGYEVHGILRRSSSFNTGRIDHIFDKLKLHHGDMLDSSNLNKLMASIRPHEVYNLAAMSHVKVSFEEPEFTAQSTGLGVLRLLEAVRSCGLEKQTRIYQASTSELFGLSQESPQRETTPFHPRSPYGVSKLFAHWTIVNYRESYGLFCCSGILFNHESPRRGPTFVTRKVTMALARIVAGQQDVLRLGNLDAFRDWGHARDHVRAMWMMLQAEEPRDLVVATGEQHSVREFVSLAFRMAGMPLEWRGEGVEEVGVDSNGVTRVVVDPQYFRPAEVESLLGHPQRAKEELGWRPEVCFPRLVLDMVRSDLLLLGGEKGRAVAEGLQEDEGVFAACQVEPGFKNSLWN